MTTTAAQLLPPQLVKFNKWLNEEQVAMLLTLAQHKYLMKCKSFAEYISTIYKFEWYQQSVHIVQSSTPDDLNKTMSKILLDNITRPMQQEGDDDNSSISDALPLPVMRVAFFFMYVQCLLCVVFLFD